MPKVEKRETLKSLRAALAEEKRLRQCDVRDYRAMLAERDFHIQEARRSIARAHELFEIASNQFKILRTTLSLVNTLSLEAGQRAGYFEHALSAVNKRPNGEPPR